MCVNTNTFFFVLANFLSYIDFTLILFQEFVKISSHQSQRSEAVEFSRSEHFGDMGGGQPVNLLSSLASKNLIALKLLKDTLYSMIYAINCRSIEE